jgi:hypothetical protein
VHDSSIELVAKCIINTKITVHRCIEQHHKYISSSMRTTPPQYIVHQYIEHQHQCMELSLKWHQSLHWHHHHCLPQTLFTTKKFHDKAPCMLRPSHLHHLGPWTWSFACFPSSWSITHLQPSYPRCGGVEGQVAVADSIPAASEMEACRPSQW